MDREKLGKTRLANMVVMKEREREIDSHSEYFLIEVFFPSLCTIVQRCSWRLSI
jgi:hypothetical protein